MRTRFGVRMMSDILKGNLKAIGRLLDLGGEDKLIQRGLTSGNVCWQGSSTLYIKLQSCWLAQR